MANIVLNGKFVGVCSEECAEIISKHMDKQDDTIAALRREVERLAMDRAIMKKILLKGATTDQVRGLMESNAKLEKDWTYFSELCTKQQAKIGILRDSIDRYSKERQGYYNEASEGWTKFRQAERRLKAVQEIYAGMEGFKPETAPEGYCLRIIEQMYRASMGDE